MEDKKEYLRDIAKEHWECGQPFSSDDFRLFQRLCKEDGFDVDGKDWSYYWECYEDCRYNDNVQNYDMEDLTEAAGEKNARRRVWGSDWNAEHTGASNLDFFGEYLLDEIRFNLEGLTCNVGGKQRLAIDLNRTELKIDKDPAPGESVKERRISGWVYFNSNFNVIMEDRQVLKQKVVQAFKAGMVDFNDKYKSDYLVCKDMILISKSFKYGNDSKSMYLVFRAEEEKYHNEKPQAVIVHKHSRESLDVNDMFVQNAFPLTIDDNNVVTTNATKPANATYAGANVGYYWWTELEKESDASGPAERTTIYYFETPSDLNKYLSQHPDKENLVLSRIYENTNNKSLFDSILRESYHCWEDFYRQGCKLGLKDDMTKLDVLHDKFGGFKNVPNELIQDIIQSIPDDDYDVYNFVEEMIDYFGF